MKKRINFLLFFLVVFFGCFDKTFAAEVYKGNDVINYIDGVLFVDNTGGNAVDLHYMTDGNDATRARIPFKTMGGENGVSHTFDVPIDIDGYLSISSNTRGIVSFINVSGVTIDYSILTGDSNVTKEINIKNIKTIMIKNDTQNYLYINSFEVYGLKIDHLPVTDLRVADVNHNSAKLSWVNPDSASIKNILIKKNGQLVDTLADDKENYDLTGLESGKNYKIDVVVRYVDGIDALPTTSTLTTLKAPVDAGDVAELSANAMHNRVDLSWILPNSNNFKHVNIYRETLKKSFFDKMLGINTVMAATPIFETNGTYFNDLTVQSETKYEYTLTTTSTEKIESDGVSVTVTTLKDPTPEIGGGGYDKDPDTGDYTYYWAEPKTGKVKVMVGGKLYATVQASDGKITIPSASMKFTLLGKPDVHLIPVDEDGNEGKPVKPPSGGGNGGGNGDGGGIDDLPFTGNELLKNTFDLLKLIGPYLVVALSFYLAPRFIAFIKKAVQQRVEERKNVE